MFAIAQRFVFDNNLPLGDAEMSLHLAMLALEGLVGRAAVRLDARYELDDSEHAIAVDNSTEIGSSLVKVFTALLIREFGEESFQVHCVRSYVRESAATVPVEPLTTDASAA